MDDNIGIVVSYDVKVKVAVAMGGDLTCTLPFMLSTPPPNPQKLSVPVHSPAKPKAQTARPAAGQATADQATAEAQDAAAAALSHPLDFPNFDELDEVGLPWCPLFSSHPFVLFIVLHKRQQSDQFELVFEEFVQSRAEKFFSQGSVEDASDDDDATAKAAH